MAGPDNFECAQNCTAACYVAVSTAHQPQSTDFGLSHIVELQKKLRRRSQSHMIFRATIKRVSRRDLIVAVSGVLFIQDSSSKS